MPISPSLNVKTIGSNGQISLGKQFAGRQVVIEEREPGVWLVRTAQVIPDNERWIHEPKAMKDLEQALQRAVTTPINTSNTDELLERWAKELQGGSD